MLSSPVNTRVSVPARLDLEVPCSSARACGVGLAVLYFGLGGGLWSENYSIKLVQNLNFNIFLPLRPLKVETLQVYIYIYIDA